MKKMIMPALLAAVMLVSCGEKSKKGAWIAADKDKYISECKKAAEENPVDGMEASTVAKFVDGVCDCTFKKLEAQYENYDEANKDEAGVTKIGEECGMEVALSLMDEMLKNQPEVVEADTTAMDSTVVE